MEGTAVVLPLDLLILLSLNIAVRPWSELLPQLSKRLRQNNFCSNVPHLALIHLTMADYRKLSGRRSVVLSPNSVKKVSRSEYDTLEKMVDERITYNLFGNIEVDKLMFKAYMTLKVEDVDENIAGAACFQTHPNIPCVEPSIWTAWLNNLYGLEQVTSHNSVWVHLLVWDPTYQSLFLRPIVQQMFKRHYFLQHILMILPPGMMYMHLLDHLGTMVMPKDCVNPKSSQIVYLIQKQNFMDKYKIRRAVEEDNDDLIPLINTNSKRLQELYGNFYIAELLTRHKDTERQIIVAEHNGVAVAVLILNGTVNYKLLNEEFELVPVNGLRKPHPDDADFSVDILYLNIEQVNQDEDMVVTQIVDEKSLESTSIMSFDDDMRKLSISSSSDYSLVFTTGSLFVFQDDDFKEEDLEPSDSGPVAAEEYLKIPRRHDVYDHEQLSNSTSTRSKINVKIPRFMGEGNAFCLEVAAVQPDHENALVMLMESSFECFPDKEYLAMSVPPIVPLKRMNHFFTRIPPRSDGCFPFELFVMHKNNLLGQLKVEAVTVKHEQQVRRLLATIPNQYFIQHQFETYLEAPENPLYCYVLLIQEQVVGFAILSEEFDVSYIDWHYNLLPATNPKKHSTGHHGSVDSLVLCPVFVAHAKFFLREMHALSDFSILYYKHMSFYSNKFKDRPIMNLLNNMFPIMPRNRPDYDVHMLEKEGYTVPNMNVVEEQEAFALYVSVNPLTGTQRYNICTRIVVVGSSHTALSFLESLLLTQDIRNPVIFTNVTLVGVQGLNTFRALKKVRESFTVQKNFIDARRMDMISVRTYVNLVQGKVTKLNRKEQYVVLNDTSFLPYDLLFLMTGEQFRRPAKIAVDTEYPENVFIVNNAMDANKAIVKLKELVSNDMDPDYIIVVYGHFLQAYVTIAGLISYGLPGSHIVFVEPFPYSMAIEKRHRHNVSVFNDLDVDDAVMANIRNQGIEVYSSYYFIEWQLDQVLNIIISAKFEAKHHMLEVPCTAMFFFSDKGISPRINRVITEAGLVFDGRLVINPKCQTNDPRIYGAGTLTKYSRKYYASHMTHKYFNRVEIGYELGQQIKNMLVSPKYTSPEKDTWNIHMERGDSLVPRYVKPIMRYCRLPGGINYFSMVKPGRTVPLETAINLPNYGQVFITGNCKTLDRQGFFRLHLNEYKTVETLTCLSKEPIDIHNLCNLWGKHEKMLNNLQLRFEMALITDLFDYFKEPWTYAIYHDRFHLLMEDLDSLMTSTVGSSGFCLASEVVEAYKKNKWATLTSEQMSAIEDKFNKALFPKLIEKKVLEFVKRNLDNLPMYAHPIIIKIILEGFNKSPMFSY